MLRCPPGTRMNDAAGIIQKKESAISVLREHRAVLVALSGGVDSAVLLAIACEAVGPDRVLAVTGRSPAVTKDELEDAARVARRLAVRHEVVDTFELERSDYRANAGDRCFHCRSELFEVLLKLGVDRGIDAVAYGAIVDDLADDRPGMVAAGKFGILAPLLDAGIGKSEVRTLANMFELHVHEKHANPCLASRIPIGTEVTVERLRQVEAAEAALRGLGFRQLRVRHHGQIARIELGDGEVWRLADPSLRSETIRQVKSAGYRFVVVDLEGYRSAGQAAEPFDRLYSIGPSRDSGQ
jgi:uncharacterized protein